MRYFLSYSITIHQCPYSPDLLCSPGVNRQLTLMLLVANLANTKWCKKLINDWNPSTWVLIWQYSARAIQWIPTWQSLRPYALDESCISIGGVKLLEVWQGALIIDVGSNEACCPAGAARPATGDSITATMATCMTSSNMSPLQQ